MVPKLALQHIYIIHIQDIAGNLTGWVAFRLEDLRETEGENQTRAENNKDEKEEKLN